MSAPVDYEVEYNNRARVPENPALIAGWARDAAAYRARQAPRLIRYGAGARNVIDYFPGSHDGPIVVFIHGGYWQALDNSFFSHLAGGLNAHGIGVAIPSYDLCPDVSVDSIIAEMREACRELARLGQSLVVSGHSAGGHLAACMLATDWPALRCFAAARPRGVGLFHFGSVRSRAAGRDVDQPRLATRCRRRQDRKSVVLESAGGQRVSMRWWAKTKAPNIFGKAEPSSRSGAPPAVTTRFGVVAGANHFTAIAPLADPGSPMVSRLKQLAGR